MFLKLSPTFADINVTGNINVTGDLNTVSVTDLDVTDQTITLGAGQNEASSGGSGIVILSVPTINYSGNTTGSPTITTSGSNTIITFTSTGSGTYTA